MLEEREGKTIGQYFSAKVFVAFLSGIIVGALFSVPLVERGVLGTDFFASVFENNAERTRLPAEASAQAGNEPQNQSEARYGAQRRTNAELTRTSRGLDAGQAIVSGENLLVVVEQPAGYSIIMSMVSLTQSGWLAIHEETAEGGMGNILGARRFSDGKYFGSAIELLRATENGRAYVVVLHEDNGDSVFDFEIEGPARDISGNLIAERFVTTF